MSGIFIVLEGIDGTGKTTLCAKVKAGLESLGRTAVTEREPTGGDVGALIAAGAAGDSQVAEALLFAADRALHTREIESMLARDVDVVCDRYFASSLAYQSSRLCGERIGREWIMGINRPAIRRPDITFLLDMDPADSLGRVESRGARSRYEDLEYLRRVRQAYLEVAAEHSLKILDASRAPDDLCGEMMRDIGRLI